MMLLPKRKAHGKGGFRCIALHGDAAAVQLHDLPDDGQADARSFTGMGGIALIEFIKDALLLLRRDGWAVVRYVHLKAALLRG